MSYLRDKSLELVDMINRYLEDPHSEYPLGSMGVEKTLKIAQIYATLEVAEQLRQLQQKGS